MKKILFLFTVLILFAGCTDRNFMPQKDDVFFINHGRTSTAVRVTYTVVDESDPENINLVIKGYSIN